MTFPLDHLSASFIKAYLDCHRKGRLYKDRAPSSMDPRYAEAGSVVHSAIEMQYNPQAEPFVPDHSLMDAAMVKRTKEALDGFRMIQRRTRRLAVGQGQQAEYEFRWHPEPDVEFLGYIDLLTLGKVAYIDDWKTGVENPKDELQMQLYRQAIHEMMDIPTRDIVTTLHYLRTAKSKEVPPSHEDIGRWLSENVIVPIRNGDWTPNRGSHCTRCEYRKACEGMD